MRVVHDKDENVALQVAGSIVLELCVRLAAGLVDCAKTMADNSDVDVGLLDLSQARLESGLRPGTECLHTADIHVEFAKHVPNDLPMLDQITVCGRYEDESPHDSPVLKASVSTTWRLTAIRFSACARQARMSRRPIC